MTTTPIELPRRRTAGPILNERFKQRMPLPRLEVLLAVSAQTEPGTPITLSARSEAPILPEQTAPAPVNN